MDVGERTLVSPPSDDRGTLVSLIRTCPTEASAARYWQQRRKKVLRTERGTLGANMFPVRR